jgi:hypothetical protein
MNRKTTYLALCFLGAVLPYWQFLPWVAQHGMNPDLFLQELFANRISTFFALDVIVSAVVLFRFVRAESARIGIRSGWIPIAATLTVGVSLGLPMFLYMRERRLEGSTNAQ